MVEHSIILDANGQPLPKNPPALKGQQTEDNACTAQLHREFAQHPSRGLTPARLHRIIEAAEQGDLLAQSDLFEDMEEKDPQIGADMAKRRQLAASLEWQIVPPENADKTEKRAADFANELFASLDVEDMILDMSAAIGHGWGNLELPWQRDGEYRIIEQPLLRPHRWFRLHPDDQNHLTLRDNSATGAELWPLGWVQHRHKARPGYIARSGLHRQLVWPYLFQSYALGDLAELLEIYGLPARIGKYPDNATGKQKATLLRAVTSLGHHAAGIIPHGMEIDFKEAAAGKGDLFEVMIHWCERAKSKVILGGTLTSGTGEGTNTNALGNVHERGLSSLIHSDARQYASTLNRDVLYPLAALNFGISNRRRAPRFYLDTTEREDYARLATSLPVYVNMGAEIPLWWLHEKTGIPKAGPKDAILRPVPQGMAPLRGQVAALKAEPPAASPAALIAQRLAQDTDKPMAAWIDTIETMVEQATDLDELHAMLLAAAGELAVDDMATVLGDAFTAAHAAGRYDASQESE